MLKIFQMTITFLRTICVMHPGSHMLTLKIQSNTLFSRLKLERRETIKSKKRKKWKPETEENVRKFFLKLIFLKYPQIFRKTHWKNTYVEASCY